MCIDPWDYGIRKYVSLYSQAIYESTRQDRDEKHRHMWFGKVEGFAKGYPDKLAELDDDELEEWLDDIASFDRMTREVYLPEAEKEQKRRAEEASVVG